MFLSLCWFLGIRLGYPTSADSRALNIAGEMQDQSDLQLVIHFGSSVFRKLCPRLFGTGNITSVGLACNAVSSCFQTFWGWTLCGKGRYLHLQQQYHSYVNSQSALVRSSVCQGLTFRQCRGDSNQTSEAESFSANKAIKCIPELGLYTSSRPKPVSFARDYTGLCSCACLFNVDSYLFTNLFIFKHVCLTYALYTPQALQWSLGSGMSTAGFIS